MTTNFNLKAATVIKLLFINFISCTYGWDQDMPGGLKLKIEGETFSFTSDLCSGGIFFKQPVQLESLCSHGYFLRRPNGCRMSESDLISGQYYACTDYDVNNKTVEVQAFIPVTVPELPLEHTIAFFDDADTLKNFRRYSYIKAMQRKFYMEKEPGSSGIVVSNSHNTAPVNIGKLCYHGMPEGNGSAYVLNVTGNFTGGESFGFFTRRCKPNSIDIPWRQANYYSFTEGYSEPTKFKVEHKAQLPGLFPESAIDDSEKGQGPSPGVSEVTDIPELDFWDKQPGMSGDGGNSIIPGAENGFSAEDDSIPLLDFNDGPQAEDNSSPMPGFIDSSELEDDSIPILDFNDGSQPENNSLPIPGFNDSSEPADDNSIPLLDFNDGLQQTPDASLDPGAASPLLDFSDGKKHNDSIPLLVFPDVVGPTSNITQTTPEKPSNFLSDFETEIFRHGPVKLKKTPIINPSLTNWDPYVEEAVVLAKYKILKDLGHTGNFDLETGRVSDKESMGSFNELPDTMWFKIIENTAEIVKALSPDELIDPHFFDDVVQLFGYLFRSLPDDLEEMTDSAFQSITGAIKKCKENAKKIKVTGVGCPKIFKEFEVEHADGVKEYLDLDMQPPLSNSFNTHTNDVVVESAWNFIDIAVCKCYPDFLPDNISEHHRLFVYMKQFFRHERIQKRWYSSFKGVDTYAGLLPYGHFKIIMYNYDKLKAALHNDCLYSGWISKPELRDVGHEANPPLDDIALEKLKTYEIWNGKAYCLQANYKEEENGKMSMSGIIPSIEQLSSHCQKINAIN